MNFSQMRHARWAVGLSLYNHMHKFKHVICVKIVRLGAVPSCIIQIDNSSFILLQFDLI